MGIKIRQGERMFSEEIIGKKKTTRMFSWRHALYVP